MAIPRIDLLSCGNLDKTPMKTLDFDARQFSTMGRSMLLLAWEKIKEAILCLPLFMFIIYYKKALIFLAILGIVWETFLKNQSAGRQLIVSIIVQWSLNTLKHKCLALLNILNSFIEFFF